MRFLWIPVPEAFQQPIQACRGHIMAAAGFSALINILYLAPTIYMMQVYDRVVPTGGLQTLYWLTFIVALAIAVLTALDALRVQLMIRASLRLDRLLAPVILEQCMLRREAGAANLTTGAMRQFDVLRQTLGGPAVLAMFDVPWAPLYVFVAFLIHPLLGGLVLLGAGVLVLLAWANQRRVRRGAERAFDATSAAYASQEASVREAELVRALGMRRSMVKRHVGERRAGFAATLDVQLSGSRYNSLVKFVRMFMQSAALGAGAWLAVAGEISVGAIIAASVLLSRALQPVEQLVASWSTIIQAKHALKTIEALLGQAILTAAQRTALPPPEGQIAVDHVTVRGNAGAPILKNVSVEVQAGQVIGIVGPSGAGKTTLARVLSGAIVPDAGEVRLDGANIADWDPDLLARYIGYMPQNCALLPGTVGENISRFARRDESTRHMIDAEIIRTAKMAGIHEMILHLPAGYETPIGVASHLVSAGQAQRLALARALYGRPRLLILDEPNSALDSEGEEALNRAIAAAKIEGATIIIIAHRAFALQSAEMLLVLYDGAVAQYGARQEVMEELAKRARQVNVVHMPERA